MGVYVLEHNMGNASFDTVYDAIRAMWLLSLYDRDCGCSLSGSVEEYKRIARIVESGRVFKLGVFSLYK